MDCSDFRATMVMRISMLHGFQITFSACWHACFRHKKSTVQTVLFVWCLVGESDTGLLVTSELLYHLTNKASLVF